jgi:hypothetical protein
VGAEPIAQGVALPRGDHDQHGLDRVQGWREQPSQLGGEVVVTVVQQGFVAEPRFRVSRTWFDAQHARGRTRS